jgi:ribosomal protein S18 acetylase RimI-like enzyme
MPAAPLGAAVDAGRFSPRGTIGGMDNESLHFRQAEPADYDRAITVVDDWWGRPVRALLPRLYFDHFHQTSIVAEHGSDLAGFVVGFFSPAIRKAAYIHFVGVAPSFRGTGLGRELYHRFFGLARADGRSVVRAVTSPQNRDSIAFHTAMGFTVTGPVPGYDGPARDRIVFQLGLDRPLLGHDGTRPRPSPA